MEAMADEAIRNITGHISTAPDKPFMLFWAPVAMHSPHQAPTEYIEKYKGKFDMGWDEARKMIHEKQLELGIIPEGTKLTERTEESSGLLLTLWTGGFEGFFEQLVLSATPQIRVVNASMCQNAVSLRQVAEEYAVGVKAIRDNLWLDFGWSRFSDSWNFDLIV